VGGRKAGGPSGVPGVSLRGLDLAGWSLPSSVGLGRAIYTTNLNSAAVQSDLQLKNIYIIMETTCDAL